MISQQYSLELVTAPVEEPVTLGEMRSHLRLTQNQDDTEISSIWVPAARRLIENQLGLRMVTQTWKVYTDMFPYYPIGPYLPGTNYDGMSAYRLIYSEIPIGPVQSVTSIKYLDTSSVEQTLATSVYHADVKRPLCRILLKSGQVWPALAPATPNSVYIQFVCGYGPRQLVPQNLRAAVMLQARAMYDGEEDLIEPVKRLVGLEWSGSLDAKT